MLEEIFPLSLRGGDMEGAFPVSPKFLGCSPSMRGLWRIVLRLGFPETEGNRETR